MGNCDGLGIVHRIREGLLWPPGELTLTECGRLINTDSPDIVDVDPCPVCFPADAVVSA
ncbi:hypothetical protein [Prauserella halophila]|uniref:hypothetical protein n=1 Tax=Prauserella halophila TaxID=185641 RepID=UPI0020A60787|nr:hypothetical protein [Prauserella halophila]